MTRALVLALGVVVVCALLLEGAHGAADYGKYNKRVGAKFMEEKAAEEGVTCTDSGLCYKVNRQGSGKTHPTKDGRVTVHYQGTLIDGTEFDSSYSRGQPATFGVGQVISGWTEVLQLMVVGDEFMVYIPSDLGYGERGSGRKIGPNSTLIFKVELITIEGVDEKHEL